jgi:hypothetical protein
MVLPYLCPDIDTHWLRDQPVENCSITELFLEVRDGQPQGRLVRWASHAHLSGDAAEIVPGLPQAGDFISE